MSENRVLSAAQIACFAVMSLSCGSSSAPPDAAPLDASVDASAPNQLREDFCGYWPLDPGPSCGEALYGSVDACLQAIEPCADRELLGVGFCWETADERCDAECLPACAEDSP